ncbi:CapA family protein [Paraburkholderia strydomiana]|uniref:CapA family protein n=1 Tax=Paraburkholderia strydomiana TaxID=1245417 RepID=UPI00286611E4|nr:CapA family protein [Paraburkholderia strydomiana]MDR7009643.1 poly-gamma-glutamate synthesis protein (capsule biosynthesis protein) [Paraburkholderia strydomiana]
MPDTKVINPPKRGLPPGNVSIAAVGDIIITVDFLEQMGTDRDCRQLQELLHTADLVVGNYEGSIIDMNSFQGYPAALSGFGWLITNPDAVRGLRALNLRMLSRANNHATDWGRDGMEMTNQYLRNAGFAISGTGSSRLSSREPAQVPSDIVELGGRAIAMTSWTTEVVTDSTASNPLGVIRARPGVSTLRRRTFVRAGPEAYNVVKELAEALGIANPLEFQIDGVPVINILGNLVEIDPNLSPPWAIIPTGEFDEHDYRELTTSISSWSHFTDFLIGSQHHHGLYNNTTHVDEYSREFAREVVDRGVRLLFGHGPHRLRGVEVHNGAPIFHSLGNFFYTNNTQEYVTPDEWERYIWRVLNRHLPEDQRIVLDPKVTSDADFLDWIRLRIFWSEQNFRSVVAFSDYQDGALTGVRFYPIELFFDRPENPRQWRGIPRLTNEVVGTEILDFLNEACKQVGTSVEIEIYDEPTGRQRRAMGHLKWTE